MNLTNYHSHCVFCDGRADMESFVRFAVAQGFTSYGISSHAPLPYHTAWSMDWEHMKDYLNEFQRVKKKYDGLIEYYLGLEIDYLNDNYNPSSPFFQELPLDYRIGSVHLLEDVKGATIDIDVAPVVFKDIVDDHFDGSLELLVNEYFRRQQRMLELGGFDILGHPDKLHYNANLMRPGIMEEKWFSQLVESLFETVAQKGMMVEVNTKSFETYGVFFPNKMHFELLRQMNIPVMVNSDAHYPERINSGRPEALGALKNAGYESVRELYQGKWIDVKLEI